MKSFEEYLIERKDSRVPVTIRNHPGVEEALWGPDSGVDDYKYDVFLKDGWEFENGRMAGSQSGHFNNVGDFRTANPVKKK